MNERRMARVRRVRELQERALRAEWAEAQRAALDAEAWVQSVLELRGSAEAALEARVSAAALDAREVLHDEATLARLEGALAAADARRRDAQRAADLRRAAWQARRTDAEALRRLEARYRTLRRAAAEKAETARADDLASARRTQHMNDTERDATESQNPLNVEIDR